MFDLSVATAVSFDDLLKRLEVSFDTLLDKLRPLLNLSPEQVARAEADIISLTNNLRTMWNGETDTDSGLQNIVIDVSNILRDLGASVQQEDVSETTSTCAELALLWSISESNSLSIHIISHILVGYFLSTDQTSTHHMCRYIKYDLYFFRLLSLHLTETW